MPISIQDIIKDENITNAMNFLMTKRIDVELMA